MGVLTDAPEIRVTNQGESMAKFSLSVERPNRAEEAPKQIDLIDIIAWRQTADSAKDLQKGSLALVEGRIITRTLEDPSGQKKYLTEVEAREIRNLGGSSVDQGSDTAPIKSKPAKKSPSLETAGNPPVKDEDFDFSNPSFKENDLQFPPGFGNEIDEEIPF